MMDDNSEPKERQRSIDAGGQVHMTSSSSDSTLGRLSNNGIVSSKFYTEIPRVDLWSLLRPSLEQYANSPAIIELFDDGRTLTFRELHVWSEAIAGQLHQHGLGNHRTDRLAMYSPNCIEYVLVFLATQRLGVTLVTVNYMSTADELHYCLNLSEAVVLVTAQCVLDNAMKAASALSSVHTVFVIGAGPGATTLIGPPRKHPNIGSSEHLASPTSLPPEIKIDPFTNAALVLFSSGTTGLPKAVALSHYNMAAILTSLEHESVKTNSRYRLVYQPMSHIFGMGVMSSTFANGSTLLLQSKFNLHDYLTAAAKYEVPILHIVPPIAAMMAKTDLSSYNLSYIRTVVVASAPLSATVETQLKASVGNPYLMVAQAYGLTETSGIITMTPFSVPTNQLLRSRYNIALPPPSGSCGLLFSNTEAKVVDVETGEVLGPLADGEILARGPQVMLGYHNNIPATRAMLDQDGWLRTGDIGHYDRDGYFFIVDRAKELIKYNGFQVAPAELEAIIIEHPGVFDVGILGIADEQAGELPQAWVVRKADSAALTERDIVNWVEGRSAPYKWLRGGVRFVESIPRSPTGKILRRIMRDTSSGAKL